MHHAVMIRILGRSALEFLVYLGEIGNYVVCLGGNQSDAVWLSVYHKKYVTAFRLPKI